MKSLEGGRNASEQEPGHNSTPILWAKNVAKSFGGVHALVDAHLSLFPGEIHGVIGENGSGKSTLLRIFAGQHSADTGQFKLRGEPVSVTETMRQFRSEVALVSQELSLANDLSVGENILLRPRKPGRRFKISWDQVHAEAKRVLTTLGIDLDTHRRVSTLPLAQRQLVEIARVIAQESPVMILDEPTSALSDKEVGPLFDVLQQLAEGGTSIVIVTHRLDELLSVSDRLTVLRDSKTVASAPRDELDRASLIRLMLGHDPEEYTPPASTRDARHPILTISDIPTRLTAEAPQVEVREREVLGLFGLADAGCSELLKRIAGANRDGSGTMKFNDRDYDPRTPSSALRSGVAYVPADRATAGLVSMMSIVDNIHVGAPHVRSRLRQIRKSHESTNASEFVSSLHVRTASTKTPVRNLSGGNQQKVLLAKALSVQPKILALEEPTRGVDIGAKDEIHRILHRLRDDGMSLVVVSTDIEEMLLLCDRFYVMRDGVVTGELTRESATKARLTHLATAA